MNVHDGKAFTGLSGNSDAFALRGGRHQFVVAANFDGGGGVGVETLAADGATWVACADPLEVNGVQILDLAPGQYRVAVNTATAVNASLVSVPA
ncbi:MAG TPA: hypothetical protein VHD59_06870 [Pseudolabrys sp.]|nr:hypothetical protein [Pseudolabrys sp.]